jgi:hypothetical protein
MHRWEVAWGAFVVLMALIVWALPIQVFRTTVILVVLGAIGFFILRRQVLAQKDRIYHDSDQRRYQRYHHRFSRFDSTQKPVIKPKSGDRPEQSEVDHTQHGGQRPAVIQRTALRRETVTDD